MVLFRKKNPEKKCLIIKNDGIGDLILASGIIKSLSQEYDIVDILTCDVNETLKPLMPYVQNWFFVSREAATYNTKTSRFEGVVEEDLQTLREVRQHDYDVAICLRRFIRANSLFLMQNVDAKRKISFWQYPTNIEIDVAEKETKDWEHVTASERILHESLYFCECIKKSLKLHVRTTPSLSMPEVEPKPERANTVAFNIASKGWSDPFKYVAMAERLLALGVTVKLFGGSNENETRRMKEVMKKCPQVENYCGKLSFAESVKELSQCKYYVGNDTGLSHLAMMTCDHVLVLHGGGGLGRFFPWPDVNANQHVFYHAMSCFDCAWLSCLRADKDCLRLADPNYIAEQLKLLMSGNRLPALINFSGKNEPMYLAWPWEQGEKLKKASVEEAVNATLKRELVKFVEVDKKTVTLRTLDVKAESLEGKPETFKVRIKRKFPRTLRVYRLVKRVNNERRMNGLIHSAKWVIGLILAKFAVKVMRFGMVWDHIRDNEIAYKEIVTHIAHKSRYNQHFEPHTLRAVVNFPAIQRYLHSPNYLSSDDLISRQLGLMSYRKKAIGPLIGKMNAQGREEIEILLNTILGSHLTSETKEALFKEYVSRLKLDSKVAFLPVVKNSKSQNQYFSFVKNHSIADKLGNALPLLNLDEDMKAEIIRGLFSDFMPVRGNSSQLDVQFLSLKNISDGSNQSVCFDDDVTWLEEAAKVLPVLQMGQGRKVQILKNLLDEYLPKDMGAFLPVKEEKKGGEVTLQLDADGSRYESLAQVLPVLYGERAQKSRVLSELLHDFVKDNGCGLFPLASVEGRLTVAEFSAEFVQLGDILGLKLYSKDDQEQLLKGILVEYISNKNASLLPVAKDDQGVSLRLSDEFLSFDEIAQILPNNKMALDEDFESNEEIMADYWLGRSGVAGKKSIVKKALLELFENENAWVESLLMDDRLYREVDSRKLSPEELAQSLETRMQSNRSKELVRDVFIKGACNKFNQYDKLFWSLMLLEKIKADDVMNKAELISALVVDDLDQNLFTRLDDILKSGQKMIKHYDILASEENRNFIMMMEVFAAEDYYFKCESLTPKILDLGVNRGVSVAYFKRMFPKAEITCFEPIKTLYEKANEFFEKNGWMETVTFLNKAVAGKKGETIIHLSENDDMASSLREEMVDWRGESNTQSVECVVLSEYIDDHIDMLKMDIEGAEVEVLRECQDKLRNIDNIVCEVHCPNLGEGQFANKPLVDVLQILNEAGFRSKVKESLMNTLRHKFKPIRHSHEYQTYLVYASRLDY